MVRAKISITLDELVLADGADWTVHVRGGEPPAGLVLRVLQEVAMEHRPPPDDRSWAARAGVRSGDVITAAIDGQPIPYALVERSARTSNGSLTDSSNSSRAK